MYSSDYGYIHYIIISIYRYSCGIEKRGVSITINGFNDKLQVCIYIGSTYTYHTLYRESYIHIPRLHIHPSSPSVWMCSVASDTRPNP